MNTTLIVAIIGMIAAVFSPPITAFINNQHQLKKIKLESSIEENRSRTQHIKDIYEEYAISTGRCIMNHTTENITKYGAAYGPFCFVAPSDLIDDVVMINNLLKDHNCTSALPIFNKVILHLSKLVQSM